jgi:hypothetical protein
MVDGFIEQMGKYILTDEREHGIKYILLMK